jgi:hypothetical protein
MLEKSGVSYTAMVAMKAVLAGAIGVFSAFVLVATQGCSDKTSDQPVEDKPVLACSPATDAGVVAAADAGVTAKIIKPSNGQKFSTKEKVQFQGTGSDKAEGAITDPLRMIWNVGDPVKGINPDGEGPEDEGGPYAAGTYIVRFDVSNKACLTAADTVTITIE